MTTNNPSQFPAARDSGGYAWFPIVHSEVSGAPLLGWLAALLRQRYLILATIGICIALGIGRALLTPREFLAVSKFMPQGSETDVSVARGLAAQLGVNIGGGGGSQSSEFYTQLLRSQDVLREVVLQTYTVPSGEVSGAVLSGTLTDFYDVDGDDPEDRVRAATSLLKSSFTAETSPTGIIELRTEAAYEALSEQINRALLTAIGNFDLQKRRSQASEERRFIQQRLSAAEDDLRRAERQVEEFLKSNRNYQQSPQLSMQMVGLQRRVGLREAVYQSLAQAFEEARIAEVRNTPLLVIIEQPEKSARATEVRPIRGAAIGLILGIFLGGGLAVFKEYWESHRRRNSPEFIELQRAADATFGRSRSPR